MSILTNILSIMGLEKRPTQKSPSLLPQNRHCIKIEDIDKGSIDILYRLRSHGFKAHLVGGSVRDLLLKRIPKDFDIVTDARPRQVRSLFHGCRLIGRRFKLAHVPTRGGLLIEVATYRALTDPVETTETFKTPKTEPQIHPHKQPPGHPIRNTPDDRFAENNVFGTIDQDALRRDFTVNALYFDLRDRTIIDFTGGLIDLKKKILRSINDPDKSFKDDPVRIVRAARFAAMLGFELSKNDLKAAMANAHLIKTANPDRMLEELRKILKCGYSSLVFKKLQKYGSLQHWLPEFSDLKIHEKVLARLEALDKHILAGAKPSEELMIASLCHELFLTVTGPIGKNGYMKSFELININFRPLAIRLRVPRWIWHGATEISARQMLYHREPDHGPRWDRFLRSFLKSPMQTDSVRMLAMENEFTGACAKELEFWKNIKIPERPLQGRPHSSQNSPMQHSPHASHVHMAHQPAGHSSGETKQHHPVSAHSVNSTPEGSPHNSEI